MKIYLAGPFFNDREREIKARIKEHLEEMISHTGGYELCDPQTDGDFRSWEQANCYWGENVFLKDLHLLDACDYVVAIDWGLYGDCGTAWEIGYASGKNKHILVVAPMETLTKPHSVMVTNGNTNFITEERFLNATFLNDLFNRVYFAAGVEQK